MFMETTMERGLKGIIELVDYPGGPNYGLMQIIAVQIRQSNVVSEVVTEYPAVYGSPATVIELTQTLATLNSLINIQFPAQVIAQICQGVLDQVS